MIRSIPRGLWPLIETVLVFSLGGFAAAGETPPPDRARSGREVKQIEVLEFQQRKAMAHMQELEERLFRLSQILRETEPDNAARLILGLRKTREELIVDDMRFIGELLRSGKLEEAAAKQ